MIDQRSPWPSGSGAALGTLNWILLALWPLLVAALLRELPTEEGLLRATFGTAYEASAARTARLVPGVWGRARDPHYRGEGS